MTPRGLEGRMKKLCEEALRTDEHELGAVLHELRGAVREYIEFLAMTKASLGRTLGVPDFPQKRNSRSTVAH